jgi:hypothetical protein
MADKYKELVDAEWEAIESVLAAAHLVSLETTAHESPSMRVLRATLAKYRAARGAVEAEHEKASSDAGRI